MENINEISTQEKIDDFFQNFSKFLKDKNKKYGDSALNAIKIFSLHEPENSICIRLDDKINRIINSNKKLRKNDVSDLIGYLSLLCIQKNWTKFEDLID